MNRGSTATLPACFSSISGFNEAPIHESGKLGQARRVLRCLAASMRPRFMNRGSRLWEQQQTRRMARLQ